MTYASLLVTLEDGEDSDRRLDLACDLAGAFGAHLIGFRSSSIGMPLTDSLMDGAMTGELLSLYRDMAETEVQKGRARFEALVKAKGLDGEWRGRVGYPSDLCCQTARAADLLILPSHSPSAPHHAPEPVGVLMGCGRPVLITPSNRSSPPFGAPALVAWRDSREARRALIAALPLLQRAAGVTVYAVCDPDRTEEVEAELVDVCTYLARHDIIARPEVALKGDMSIGRQILREALALEVGLIVAGGYGHARLREWALGGVTRDLIETSSICLCLSH